MARLRTTSPEVEFTDDISHMREYRASDDALRLWTEIRKLRLEDNIAELEVLGYTVVPPEKVGAPGLVARLQEAILDVAERRLGERPDVAAGTVRADPRTGFGPQLFYLLFEDEAFRTALLNETGLTLASYLVGANCIVSNCIAGLKGPCEGDLALHADHALLPSPFPHQAQVCNVTWLLTDYNQDNGALCFVPGSHRQARRPSPGEALDERVAVEAPAGSIVFWHGSTWHGAFARRSPGLRMNLLFAMMRPHLRPQEPYREDVTDEMLNRYPERFARLLGHHINYGWREDGPANEGRAYSVGRSYFD